MKFDSERNALPLFSRRLIAIAAFALCSGQALAVEPFTVKDIRVEGIQRTEAGTVFSYLPVRVGDTFNDEKAATAIKALYATGFFKDAHRCCTAATQSPCWVENQRSVAARLP